MKYLNIILFIIFLNCAIKISAQVPSVGGGLAFSSGIYVNGMNTGNPGLNLKGYFKIGKQLKLVPSVTGFLPIEKFWPAYEASLKNYMFHGDFDAHFSLYKNDPLRFIGFAGINVTSIISKWNLEQNIGQTVKNINNIYPGLNLGGAIYMFVNNSFDAIISGKYIAASTSQFVISIGVIYYPEGLRRKGGW